MNESQCQTVRQRALMARIFGGSIATVMGGNVVRDERAILAGIGKD